MFRVVESGTREKVQQVVAQQVVSLGWVDPTSGRFTIQQCYEMKESRPFVLVE